MIKDSRRYRNFMIVFDDDRYYICKASSFSKDGNNRYNWKDIETIDDAKKIIDKYWEDNDEEVSESMVKYSRKIESKDDEDLEVLNELEDEDIPYPENPNLLNLIDYYMDKYDMDEENATTCAISDLEAEGKYTRYFDEATNPSNIGQFKRSIINRARKGKKKDEDRIVTKDDELNKPTNVRDDSDNKDTIEINVPDNNTNSNKDDKEDTEVVLTEVSDIDKSNIVIEQGAKIDTKHGTITINRLYSHWNPFEDIVETKADIEIDKNGNKIGYDTISVDKLFGYIK